MIGAAPILAKTAKRKILIVIGVLAAMAIISIVIFTFVRSSSKVTIVPYNLSWGDPYSKLKNANSETTEIKKNDAGNYLCSCKLTPSYIGLDDEAISIGANWNFKDGETLQSVLIVLSPESSCISENSRGCQRRAQPVHLAVDWLGWFCYFILRLPC